MRIGIRGLLLVLAIALFLLAVLLEENALDLVAIGLALFAGSFLVGDLGLDRRGR